ncbi:hypothetical protein CXB51_002075 [Gossypium anomalum]|uniref:Retrotransposon gag domain-containing protein n=1 Tax=Gossypium anomalum TaxID=47600 RepID=A0A8J6A1L9_9ROSI|nr:hypothetical protein CXB51_002075 [Gossypium anomalum]
MSKEVVGQNEPMETRGRVRKVSRSRGLLLALENRVVTLEESMEDVKERIGDVDDRLIDGLQMMKEQLREYVWDTIGSSKTKLAGKDDVLEAMVTALKEEINELKGELKIFKVAIGNGMLASKPKQQAMDVPKPKAFKGARSASEVDNFLWAMDQYFRATGIEDDATKVNTVAMSTDVRRGGTEIGTWEEFQKEFKAQFYLEYAENEARAKLQRLTQRGTISDLSEKEAFFSFTNGLKPWAKQELQHRGVQELTNAMMVAESLVELVPRRDKFDSSKPNGRGNGGYHEEGGEGHSYYGNGSGNDSDNGKPRNGKWEQIEDSRFGVSVLSDGRSNIADWRLCIVREEQIEDSRFGVSVLSEGRSKIVDLASLYCQGADQR